MWLKTSTQIKINKKNKKKHGAKVKSNAIPKPAVLELRPYPVSLLVSGDAISDEKIGRA
mgnify:CR=1 FL=1